MERKILLNPGPVTTSNSVKNALIRPDICHREKEFSYVIQNIRQELLNLLKLDDKYTTTLLSGSGTTAMESVISSVAYPKNFNKFGKEFVLILTNGAYGHRFSQMAEANNIPYIQLVEPWGNKLDLSKIESVIKLEFIKHVFVIHHETTTGILNPIKEIGQIAKNNNCSYVVDAISSVGGIPIDIKKCNIDYLIGTSNKCIQGIPGLSFVIAKKEELEKTKNILRSVFLNLYQENQYQENKGVMRFTAPTFTMYAFDTALRELKNETIQKRYQRYSKNYDILEDGMCDLGFKLFNVDKKSKLLATFYEKENFDFKKFHDNLYKIGFTIYPGKLDKENTFRLSVMGDLKEEDIKNFLYAVDKIIKNK